jgi:simple sugar transport system permease protein
VTTIETKERAVSTTQQQASGPARGGVLGGATTVLRELALIPVILVIGVLGAIFVPHFFTYNNIVSNIIASSAALGIAVISQSIVLIGGYYDLSAQSVVGLAPMVGAWLFATTANNGLGLVRNPFLALLVILLVGAVVGLVNGFLVGKLKMNAFIVTLAMLILLQGLTLGVSGGKTFTDIPITVSIFGSATFLGATLDVWVLVIAFVIAAFFMRFHPTGRRIYALGGNQAAARAAGVRTLRLTVGLFVFSGVVAAFAGVLMSSRIASVTAAQGNNLIFTVFAAAVIGGISLDGGRGSILGAATGVLLLGTIQNILVLAQVPTFWINAFYGAIILGALLIGSPQVRGALGGLFRRGDRAAA